MSWDTQGTVWHLDHIIPLNAATTGEELKALCQYTNLQPLYARDNLSKSDKILPKHEYKMALFLGEFGKSEAFGF